MGPAKEKIDIALPATFSLPDLVEAEAIVDLTGPARLYEPNNFLDDSLYTFGNSFDSKFYGYQTDGDAYITFYNKAYIDQDTHKKYQDHFGRSWHLPQTWSEFDKQVMFFHDPKKQKIWRVLVSHTFLCSLGVLDKNACQRRLTCKR